MENDPGTLKMSRKILIFFALLLYAAVILYAKFFRYDISISEYASFNWVPFAIEYDGISVRSLLINAAVFVPYGLLIGYLRKNAPWFFIAGFLVCFTIEFLQPLFHAGVCDMTTVAADLIGITAGYFVYRLIAGLVHRGKGKHTAAA